MRRFGAGPPFVSLVARGRSEPAIQSLSRPPAPRVMFIFSRSVFRYTPCIPRTEPKPRVSRDPRLPLVHIDKPPPPPP